MEARRDADEPAEAGNPGLGEAGLSWSGARNRPGEPDEDAESDVPEGERQATREEMRESIRHTPGPPSGQRGDLGDSGPGED